MNILDAQVDYKEDVANGPTLEVLVDEMPDRSALRFENEEDIWFAEKDGYVEYFAWSGDGNDGGYSGRCFDVTTVDGEEVTLKGPWSSRAGIINKMRLGPVVDVKLTTDPEVLEKRYSFKSGSISLAAAKTAIDISGSGFHLEQELKFSSDEPYWIPRRNRDQTSPDATSASLTEQDV